MAIRKHINKLNHVNGVVKVVNDGASDTVTITREVDLLKSNETLDTNYVRQVAIREIEWSCQDATGEITIARNGVVTHKLYSTGRMIQDYGADVDGKDYDITVTMTSGTLLIHVIKEQGYLPNFQPEIHGGE